MRLFNALVVALIATTTAAAADLPPPRFEDSARAEKIAAAFPAIEALITHRMRELKVPGLAYGIVIDGKLVEAKGLGYRDVASRAPVDPETVFRIASMTKSFTALAILKLRDDGKLRLDDPVQRYVPEVASVPLPTRDSGPITVRQLLAHLGGFPQDDPWADRVIDVSKGDLSRLISGAVPFSNPPGAQFEYSNLGYMILGRIVTNVSGMRYQDFITREILRPLGMTSTVWEPKAMPAERVALGYERKGDGFAPVAMLDDGEGGAMGGLVTSSPDLARWISLMLSAFPARDDSEAPPALRRTLREMQHGMGTQYLSVTRAPGSPLDAVGYAYGSGLFVYRNCRTGYGVSHAGGLPGFGSHMRWLPEYGVGVFVMTNLTYAPAGLLTYEMTGLLAETGALKPRVPVASAQLIRAAADTARLVDAWDEAHARRLTAFNVALEQPLEERRGAIAKLREGLGACAAQPIKPENGLRGTFRMNCEKGWLDVSFTLAPTQPPTVQYLNVTAGQPLTSELKRTVDDLLLAMTRSAQNLRLHADADRASVGAQLDMVRVHYGQCRMTEMLDGDGVARARLRLNCDRGPLVLALDAKEGQIAKVAFTPPRDAACVP